MQADTYFAEQSDITNGAMIATPDVARRNGDVRTKYVNVGVQVTLIGGSTKEPEF